MTRLLRALVVLACLLLPPGLYAKPPLSKTPQSSKKQSLPSGLARLAAQPLPATQADSALPLLPGTPDGISDPLPVILAGAFLNDVYPLDNPVLRVDPNTVESPFAGVGSVGVDGIFMGTGTLISPFHVLACAHLVDLNADGVAEVSPDRVTFHLNYGGDSTHILQVDAIAVHPDFTGFNRPALNDDICVLTLLQAAPVGVPIYPLYAKPIKQGDQLNLVGYGYSGWGDQGFRFPYSGNFSTKRVGANVADIAFLDDEEQNFAEVFVFDFDDPASVFNFLGGTSLGNTIETTLGYGDSGGPAFVLDGGSYKLAGINTFIAKFTGQEADPPLFGSAGGGMMAFQHGAWIAQQANLPWDANTLKLNVAGSPVYLRPGQQVTIDLDALHLAQKVTALQAFLAFSSTHFSSEPGAVVVAPGGGAWTEVIYSAFNVGGDLDVAVGVDMELPGGTDADGTAAKFTLTATGEGVTKMAFRPDLVPDPGLVHTTMFSDELSLTVLPIREDSQDIVIDGTPPLVQVSSPNGGELLAGGSSVQITWTSSDAYLDGTGATIEYFDGSAWVLIAENEANDGSIDWTVPSLNLTDAKIRVTVRDLAGNTAPDESDAAFTIDSVAPTVEAISAIQGGPELTPDQTAIQGSVDVAVGTADNLTGIAAAPVVTVTDALGVAMSVVAGAESPAGTFHYTVSVGSATANGTATIRVNGLADGAGNDAAEATDTFEVNKNQISGEVELEGLVAGPVSREVRLVTSGTQTKVYAQTLSFENGVASFTLTGVPEGTTHCSAKTAWSLRRKLAAAAIDGQASVSFAGTAGKLLGGDINASNSVNIQDYSLLKLHWGPGTVGDINADGFCGTLDYVLMRANWFLVGDPE